MKKLEAHACTFWSEVPGVKREIPAISVGKKRRSVCAIAGVVSGQVTYGVREQFVVERYETLKAELLDAAAVQQVTASGDVPGRMFTAMGYWIEGMPEDDRGGINALIVDPDFAETYGFCPGG